MVIQAEIPNAQADQSPSSASGTGKHLLTVNVEDYFQVGVFQKYIQTDNWYRFESRLQHNVDRVLNLLDEHQTQATFFVLGWTAEKQPDVVRMIADAGHEVASRGYLHQKLTDLSRNEIRNDLQRSRGVLEDVIGDRVDGFRLSDGWLNKDTLWLLEEVAAAGYRYDSSLMPRRGEFAGTPDCRRIHQIETCNGPIVEIPLSTCPVPGAWMPIAGGNYQRQIPDFLMRRLVDRVVTEECHPYVMYFQVWELDDTQPKLSVADRLTSIRHYRKLDKYRRILPQYLQRYDFTSVRDMAGQQGSPIQLPVVDECLGLTADTETPARLLTAEAVAVGRDRNAATTPVTLIIPCFNEESTVEYLGNTLASVTDRLSDRFEPTVLFVDDCSTDQTVEALNRQFGDDPSVRVIRHSENRGVSAAILTGIQHAETDIVCSMDCDCSYDPHELANMLPMLTDDVSMVTASPYHKDGLVRNVPGWRLFLSRGLSAIYQKLLKQKLATWTSCFRVYRRQDLLDLPLQEDGFLGTAELAAHLVLRNRTIAEHPATLEVRLFGVSKMKTLRAILSHLRLLARIATSRFVNEPHNVSSSESSC